MVAVDSPGTIGCGRPTNPPTGRPVRVSYRAGRSRAGWAPSPRSAVATPVRPAVGRNAVWAGGGAGRGGSVRAAFGASRPSCLAWRPRIRIRWTPCAGRASGSPCRAHGGLIHQGARAANSVVVCRVTVGGRVFVRGGFGTCRPETGWRPGSTYGLLVSCLGGVPGALQRRARCLARCVISGSHITEVRDIGF